MARLDRHDGRYDSAAAFLCYLSFSVLLFVRGLLGQLTTAYIGGESDPGMFIWYLRWWRYAVVHRINPFLTHLVWAPLGFNLAWSTFIPLPACLVIPIGHAFGETVAFNLLCIVALPLAALSAFLLCRRVSGAFWPSILGGYLFGFSPFMLGQMQGGHLHLVFAFPVPLAVLVVLRRLEGEITEWRFALEVSALLIVQILCGLELFATMTVFGGFALLYAIVFFGGETRERLLKLVVPLAAAYAIAAVMVSPYLYHLFVLGFPHSPIWSFETFGADRLNFIIPENFSADLLNFIIPTETNLLGTFGSLRAITGKFGANIYENSAYIGIPLLLVIEAYRRASRQTPPGHLLTAMLASLVVASFGPILHVAGRGGLPMPWAMAERLPLVSIALPVRFMLYAFLVVAIMTASWFASSAARPLTKWIAAAAILLSIAPNPHASFWVSKVDIPAFFADRTYATELEPREIVLPLPWAQRGNSMYWQLWSDMYFRLAGGWTGISPFEFARMPVTKYFHGGIDLPEAGDQLKAYIAHFGVQAVIADPLETNFATFKQTLDSLGVTGLNKKGVWLYKIPRDSFAAYTRLSPAQVEARADALRFDAILEATGKYLADGHDPSKLSALELKRLDLLPHDWLVDATPQYFDWAVGPAPGGGVGIIIVGSYEGVRPLIERYRATASSIDYPAPARWTPESRPRLDAIKPLLMTFDAAHLAAAARSLRDSPPLESTTSFLAGVAAGL